MRLIKYVLIFISFCAYSQTSLRTTDLTTVTGTNTYIADHIPENITLSNGATIRVKFTNANTTTSTFNLDGTGAKDLVKSDGTALSSGDIPAGSIWWVIYDLSADKWKLSGGSGASGLIVGTTSIASGTNTRILFNNAGIVGEYSISGSGNVAMTNSPSFTTPNIGNASSSGLNVSGLTASRAVFTDGSKNLSSSIGTNNDVVLGNGQMASASANGQTLIRRSGALTFSQLFPSEITVPGATLMGNTAATAGTADAVVLGTGLSISGGSLNVTGAPPTGSAGGDLTGTYPNPTIANTTGTGNFVKETSPTLVTPNLGTPSTLVGTNITGTAPGLTAGSVTTIPTLSGEVSNSGNAVTLVNSAVVGKLLTGFSSAAGTVSQTDNILQAIQKLDGNITSQVGTTKLVTSFCNVLTTNTASQNATNLLACITAGSDGDSFRFPAGNYPFDPVAITKAINLIGDKAIITLGTTSAPHWVFDKDLASVKGFTFVGRGRANATYPLQSAIKMTNCSNIVVTECTFQAMPNAGIINDNTHIADLSGGYGAISVYACTFVDNKYALYHDTRGEYIVIQASNITNNDNGAYIGAGNVFYVGDQIIANTNGIVLRTGANDAHGIVASCAINHNTNAVDATNIVQGHFFRGNNIYYGVLQHTSCTGIVYENCTFESNTFRWSLCAGGRISNSTLGAGVPTIDTNYNGGFSDVAMYDNYTLSGVRTPAFNTKAKYIPSYTVTTMPYQPVPVAGDQVYVTDDVGGPVPATYDGSVWRRSTDRAQIVQATKNATTQYNLVLGQSGSDTNPSGSIQTAGIAFLQELINADVLDYLDLIYVTGTDGNNAFATLNWVNPAVKALTMVNTPSFNNSGFSSNGTTSYLNTGYVPSTDAVQYRLNDGGWFMAGNMASDASVAMGTLNSGVAGIDTQITSTFFAGRVNSTSQATFSSTDKRGNKSWAVTRNSATQVEGFVDGVSVGTQTLNSTLLPQYALYLLCRNSTGTAANFNNSANKIGLFMIGRGSKIKANIAAIHTAWTNYKTAMGI